MNSETPDEVAYRSGTAALRSGELERAIAFLTQAVQVNPEFVGAHADLGLALAASGRMPQALACLDRALQLAPDTALLLFNRGNALRALGRLPEALACYDRALHLEPEHANSLRNRGLTLIELERPLEALATFERELRLRPADAVTLNNCAYALLELRRPAEALACSAHALARRPDLASAHYNRGIALSELNRLQDAVDAFDRALALDATLAKAHRSRGNTLWRLHRLPEALESFDRALALAPSHVDAHCSRAELLESMGRVTEAALAFRTALDLAPEHDFALGKWLRCLQATCDWAGYPAVIGRLTEAVKRGKRSATPFGFVTAVDSPRLALECARAFVSNECPAQTPLWTGERYRHRRIRLAYLSADFHDHATMSLAVRLFETHDRTRFETTAISFGPRSARPIRTRLQRAFERFIEVDALTDREIAQLIRDSQIDIAVDLKGFTEDSRPQILAHRPSPVQVSYLGFPGSMAAPYIDYLVADRYVIPERLEQHYSEKVVYLPDCYQVNDITRPIGEWNPTRADLGLPHDGFVFCCFNNSYKLTPLLFEVWMRLLHRVGGSVLWLLKTNDAMVGNLRAEAARHGVAPERLIFAPRVEGEAHLARHRQADLFLDTLPCNAHTTASDALWAGLPLLTCSGQSFAARVGGSLLRAAGLPELVTQSLEEYEARAAQLAESPGELREIRRRLEANRLACPLFDTERFRRHLEAAYVSIQQRSERGEPPAALAVALTSPA